MVTFQVLLALLLFAYVVRIIEVMAAHAVLKLSKKKDLWTKWTEIKFHLLSFMAIHLINGIEEAEEMRKRIEENRQNYIDEIEQSVLRRIREMDEEAAEDEEEDEEDND